MKQLQICAAVMFLSLASANVGGQEKGYKIIVNSANPIVSITRENVSRIFLKKTTKFPNGLNASPVDLPVNSATRDTFSKDVLGKNAASVESYWQQLIFSGRDVPPPQKKENGALDFVRSNENGIGYVSAGADTTGVKVVSVTQF
jgi:ABC-type phosphate transport system substrate-binding protein